MKANLEPGPITTHGWALGRELRKALLVGGFSQVQLAEKLGCSESRLSRIITGKLDATSEEVAAMLALCGVVDDRRDFLVRMARERSITAWGKQEQLMVLRSLRRDAIRVVDYAAVMLPELLWTDDYAEVMAASAVSAGQATATELVSSVTSDNAMLRRDVAPQYEAIVSEAALRLRVGSTRTMAAQLWRLLDENARHNVTIRVVPLGLGAHAGMRGSFCLVERPDLTLAAVEDVLSVRFVEDPNEVMIYARIIGALRSVALTPSASRSVISEIAAECYRDDEDDRDGDRDVSVSTSVGAAEPGSGRSPDAADE